MTFKEGLAKKFGRGSFIGKLIGPVLYARIWHIFECFAREYEKGLTPQGKREFRRVFGE